MKNVTLSTLRTLKAIPLEHELPQLPKDVNLALLELYRHQENRPIFAETPYACDGSNLFFKPIDGYKVVLPADLFSPYQFYRNNIAFYVGKLVCFVIDSIDDDKKTITLNRIIVQKTAEECLCELHVPGDVIPATISSIVEYGYYMDIGCGVTTLLHRCNLCISHTFENYDLYKKGDTINTVLLTLNKNNKEGFSLSRKELYGTFEENASQFKVKSVYVGIVSDKDCYGSAFIQLSPNFVGLCEPNKKLEKGMCASFFIKVVNFDNGKVKLVLVDILDPKNRDIPNKSVSVEIPSHITEWNYYPPNHPCFNIRNYRIF